MKKKTTSLSMESKVSNGKQFKKPDPLFTQSIADSKMLPFYPDAPSCLPQQSMSKIFNPNAYVESLGRYYEHNDIGL